MILSMNFINIADPFEIAKRGISKPLK